MAWEKFKTLDGVYLVDWEVVMKMIRSFVRSCAILRYSRVNEESHWIGPNLHTMDVDWDAVQHHTDTTSAGFLNDFHEHAKYNIQNQITRLADWVQRTGYNNQEFQRRMHEAQTQTMANIDKSVARTQTAIDALRFTRDASAELLMVMATFVSGGAVGVGAVAVGSGLKATARAQDDPKATKGAVAATFATEFVVGLIDIKGTKMIKAAGEGAAKEILKAGGNAALREVEAKAAEKGTKLSLAVLFNYAKSATLEPAKAVIQGKTFQQGLTTGAYKAVGGMHGEILTDMVLEDTRFEGLGILADAAISLEMDRLAENEREQPENGSGQSAHPTIPPPVRAEHRLLDAVVYNRAMIGQVAIRKADSGKHPTFKQPRMFSQAAWQAGLRR